MNKNPLIPTLALANVNLTLTVNSNSFPVLNTAYTSVIYGTGQFLVNATSSALTLVVLIEVKSKLTNSDVDEHLERLAKFKQFMPCLLYTSPSPRDLSTSRMPSSA